MSFSKEVTRLLDNITQENIQMNINQGKRIRLILSKLLDSGQQKAKDKGYKGDKLVSRSQFSQGEKNVISMQIAIIWNATNEEVLLNEVLYEIDNNGTLITQDHITPINSTLLPIKPSKSNGDEVHTTNQKPNTNIYQEGLVF